MRWSWSWFHEASPASRVRPFCGSSFAAAGGGIGGAAFWPVSATTKRKEKSSRSDEAERFRLLLADELGKAHFATTEDAKTADAVLTGALSVRVYAEESRARVTVVMKTPDGLRLWEKDFQPHPNFQPHLKFGGADTVKLRAQDVAKTLRKEVDKAAKGT